MTVDHKVIIEKIGIAFLLTIVAYFAAYVFEVGYLRSFGASWQVAHVTMPSLVVSFMVIVLLVLSLGYISFVIIDIFGVIKSEAGKFIRKRVLEYVMWFAVLSLGFLVLTGKVDFLSVSISATIMPASTVVAWLLFDFRSFHGSFKKRLVESLRAFDERERKAYEPRGIEKSKIVETYYWICFVTMVIFSLAYFAGYYASVMIKPSRAFVLDNSRYAVIRDYDGVVIAKEIVEGRIGEKYIYVDSSHNKLIFYPIHVDNGVIR